MILKIVEKRNGKYTFPVITSEKVTGPFILTKLINLSNANSVSYDMDAENGNGTIYVSFNDNVIKIEEVSNIEWENIHDKLFNKTSDFDLLQFRKTKKAALDNHSEQLNPNNEKYRK